VLGASPRGFSARDWFCCPRGLSMCCVLSSAPDVAVVRGIIQTCMFDRDDSMSQPATRANKCAVPSSFQVRRQWARLAWPVSRCSELQAVESGTMRRFTRDSASTKREEAPRTRSGAGPSSKHLVQRLRRCCATGTRLKLTQVRYTQCVCASSSIRHGTAGRVVLGVGEGWCRVMACPCAQLARATESLTGCNVLWV